jgi:hypothetical protein
MSISELGFSAQSPHLALVLPVLSAYILIIAVAVAVVMRNSLKTTFKRFFVRSGREDHNSSRQEKFPRTNGRIPLPPDRR